MCVLPLPQAAPFCCPPTIWMKLTFWEIALPSSHMGSSSAVARLSSWRAPMETDTNWHWSKSRVKAEVCEHTYICVNPEWLVFSPYPPVRLLDCKSSTYLNNSDNSYISVFMVVYVTNVTCCTYFYSTLHGVCQLFGSQTWGPKLMCQWSGERRGRNYITILNDLIRYLC